MQNNQNQKQLDFIDKLAESPKKLIPAAVITVIACALCVWFVAIALDAKASKLDKKLEHQQNCKELQFSKIIKTTYKQ